MEQNFFVTPYEFGAAGGSLFLPASSGAFSIKGAYQA